ncbi:hypothetical protein EDD85DRAFT_957853 [Armillaria nabsnona]|nr:hypothetical protein EDD85DRAFT_957853 [Armillaria nabsnona]
MQESPVELLSSQEHAGIEVQSGGDLVEHKGPMDTIVWKADRNKYLMRLDLSYVLITMFRTQIMTLFIAVISYPNPNFAERQVRRIWAEYRYYQKLVPPPTMAFLDQLISDALELDEVEHWDFLDEIHDPISECLERTHRVDDKLYRHSGALQQWERGCSIVQEMDDFAQCMTDIVTHAFEGGDALEEAFRSMSLEYQETTLS